jgi:twitching motility protein PilT
MNEIFDRVLLAARKLGASDVHLKVGRPPIFRIRGQLRTLKDVPAMNSDVIETFAVNIMSQRQHQIFMENCEVDLAYGTEDGFRYRVNVFRQRGATGMVMRIIPSKIPAFDRLNLPDRVRELADEQRGLVLVTGITGSGKSTTLASLLEVVNSNRPAHIVTIEDPIEYLFTDRVAFFTQREVGLDTASYNTGLQKALRQAPDVIFLGEIRDADSAMTVLQAAETGHLVISTLHSPNVTESLDRLANLVPPGDREVMLSLLSHQTIGILSQRLLPAADGSRVVLIAEHMEVNGAAREWIRAMNIPALAEHLRRGDDPANCSLLQSLVTACQAGVVDYETALSNSGNAFEFNRALRGVS